MDAPAKVLEHDGVGRSCESVAVADYDDENDGEGGEVVVFEVRGQRFLVAKRTLRSFPDSLLAVLAAAPLDEPDQVKPNANGEYSLDRDSRYFGVMLQLYEQDGWSSHPWPPSPPLLGSSSVSSVASSPTALQRYHISTRLPIGSRTISTRLAAAIGSDSNDIASESNENTKLTPTQRSQQVYRRRARALVESILDMYTTQDSWDTFCEEVAFYQLHTAVKRIGLHLLDAETMNDRSNNLLIPGKWWADRRSELATNTANQVSSSFHITAVCYL
jgi:hypothetical protein